MKARHRPVAARGRVAALLGLVGPGSRLLAQSLIPPKFSQAVRDSAPEWQLSFGKVFWFVVLLLLGYLTITWLNGLLTALARRWPRSRSAVRRLIPIVRMSGWMLVIYLLVAVVLAPPIATLLTLTASAGIAVGFASQDILKNVFGGLMIIFDRPFQVGDKVRVGSHYGEVQNVGLRTVRLLTTDDSLVSVPNSEIVSQPVSNSNSGEANCQVVAELYLPAATDLARARRVAYLAAATSRYAYLAKPIRIVMRNEIHEGRSLLKMRIKAYVLDTRYEFAFASDMTETTLAELLDQGLVTGSQLDHLAEPPSRG